MGIANWLTLLRILLIPVFVTLLVYRRPGPALIVFAIAALTDLLDGWAARHWKDESSLGAFLDPMADKLLLTSSFVTLTYLKALPFWIAALVISRDAILVFGALLIYMLGSQIRPRPTWAGKAGGLAAGDGIVAVNGHPLRDAIDFQFRAGDERLDLTIERAGVVAGPMRLHRRGPGLGLDLAPPRPGDIATCANKCVFCFIH